MAPAERPASVTALQREIALATCTPTTAASLHDILLGPATQSSVVKVKPATAKRQLKGISVSKEPVPGSKLRSGPHGCSSTPKTRKLTGPEKAAIATETVNVVLKALTQAAKQYVANPTPFKQAGSKNSTRRSATPVRNDRHGIQNPLQEIDGNRQDTPSRRDCAQKGSEDSEAQRELLKAQTSCARVAFAFLRKESLKAVTINSRSLQIELGISALIHKLLALEFWGLAAEEISVLREHLLCLSRRWDGTDHADQCYTTQRHGLSSKVSLLDNLNELLTFSEHHQHQDLLPIIINLQLQVLKLIAAVGHTKVESLLQCFQPDCSSNPIVLVERLLQLESATGRDRAAQHLQTISQILLKLFGPTTRNSGTNKHDVEAIFELRNVALKARLRWWQLAEHRADVANDIARPFNSHLQEYLTKSQAPKLQQFIATKAALANLTDHTYIPGQEQNFARAFQKLAALAQANGMTVEATAYRRKIAQLTSCTTMSNVQRAITSCQHASMILDIDSQLSQGTSVPVIEGLHQTLQEDLHSHSTGLGELFEEIIRLQISICSAIRQWGSDGSADSNAAFSEQQRSLLRLLASSASFIARYLGKEPNEDSKEPIKLRYHQRRRSVAQAMMPFVQALVSVARDLPAVSGDDWRPIEEIIQEMTVLLIRIAKPSDGQLSSRNASEKHLETLSYVSWYRYRRLRESCRPAQDQLQALTSSIELLGHVENDVKIQRILLGRNQHLSALCESIRDAMGACQAFVSCLDLLSQMGDIGRAESMTTVGSLSMDSKDDEGLRAVSRALRGCIRSASYITLTEMASTSTHFDSTFLTDSERIFSLEVQLAEAIRLLHSRRNTTNLHESIRDLVRKLQGVTSKCRLTIHHEHLQMQVLFLRYIDPRITGSQNNDNVRKDIEISGSDKLYDEACAYSRHDRECLNILLRIQKQRLDDNEVSDILEHWTDLVRKSPNLRHLRAVVYDLDLWNQQLEVFAEHFAFKGHDLLALQVSKILVQLAPFLEYPDAGNTLSHQQINLAIQQINLGHASIGKATLEQAKTNMMVSVAVSAPLLTAWHQAYAEACLESEDYANCAASIEMLSSLTRQDTTGKGVHDAAVDRLQGFQNMATMEYLSSRLANVEGRSVRALASARLAVKVFQQVFKTLKKRRSCLHDRPTIDADTSARGLGGLADTSPEGCDSCSDRDQDSATAPNSYRFWKILPALFNGLLHLTGLFMKIGSLLDTCYYSDESRRLANALGSAKCRSQQLLLDTEIQTWLRNPSETSNMLREAPLSSGVHLTTIAQVEIQLAIAKSHRLNANLEAGRLALKRANEIFESTTTLGQAACRTHPEVGIVSIDREKSKSVLHHRNTLPKTKRKGVTGVAQDKKTARPPLTAVLNKEKSPRIEQLGIMVQHEHILNLLQEGAYEEASKLFGVCDQPLVGTVDAILHTSILARLALKTALCGISKDPVFGGLMESTLYLPMQSGDIDAIAKCLKNFKLGDSNVPFKRRTRKTAPSIAPKDSIMTAARSQLEAMHLARSNIAQNLSAYERHGATQDLQSVLQVLFSLDLALTTMRFPDDGSKRTANLAAFSLEMGRMIAIERANKACVVDQKMLLPNPSEIESLANLTGNLEQSVVNEELFSAEILNLLPSSWHVVSMTLSHDQEAIMLNQMSSGKAPFLLRIPLKRQVLMDCEEESFEFQEAKQELYEIIKQANISAHNSEDMSRKEAKIAWWETRAALDARLRDLLYNMNSVWFGGFCGILSNMPVDNSLLERFNQSLETVLEKYLPSRQKHAKQTSVARVQIEVGILELFVKLGIPSETNDLDAALEDLSHFVIDILQHNGEHNAFDEIDFDSIVVELTDALRQYHHSHNQMKTMENQRHTILVLDKHLHSFPWESLPCIQGQSISRLPSMSCLRRRLIMQRNSATSVPADQPECQALYVDARKGAYVLNPAGDLTNTQESLGESLQRLKGWDSLTHQEPAESDMKRFLEDEEIFLYFGHGSGGQYIRPKTIRNLDRCATTLLMGCSSGALTEAGRFETYGTALNYMQAGCPALVATLWDVTDKDIDRFSQNVLQKWGLCRNDTHLGMLRSPTKKTPKQKGKGRAKTAPVIEVDSVRPMPLTAAVSQSRDVCIMKYLNGAAPVVYGVPVMLSS